MATKRREETRKADQLCAGMSARAQEFRLGVVLFALSRASLWQFIVNE